MKKNKPKKPASVEVESHKPNDHGDLPVVPPEPGAKKVACKMSLAWAAKFRVGKLACPQCGKMVHDHP